MVNRNTKTDPEADMNFPADRTANEKSKIRTVVDTLDPETAFISDEDVPESEWSQTPLTTQERKPAQLAIDAKVKALYEAWVKAERPKVAQSPRKRLVVKPDHAPAVRHMLGLAGRFLDVHVKVNPPAHNPDGNEIIVFTARDRNRRTPASTPVSAPESPTPEN